MATRVTTISQKRKKGGKQMKIPDKIYLAENDKKAGETNISFWSLTPFTNHRSIKYIRKDALLEWVKDLKHIYEIPVNNRQASRLCCAKAEAFQLVIDKLNSM